MLRIRIDGGQLSLAQLRAIADDLHRFGRDTADITDRQNVQLHWVRIEDVPAIWQELEAVGLSTAEACGDTPRVVLGSPVAGVAETRCSTRPPAINEIVERYVGDKALLQPAAQVQVRRSPGCPTCPYQANDISFLGVVHPEHGPGFDLWVGGGLSTNPMLAQRLGVWVPLDEVAEVWAGVVGIFRDYGYRRLRSRARLKFLVADWGVERFREVLEERVPGPRADRRPGAGAAGEADRPHRRAPAVRRPVLRRRAPRWPAELRHPAGRGGRPRRGARQRPGAAHAVPEAARPRHRRRPTSSRWCRAAARSGWRPGPSTWRRSTMACTGIEFCKLAIVETKARAAELVAHLEAQARATSTPTSPSTSTAARTPAPAPRSPTSASRASWCAAPDGEMVEGFQIHLGGGLGMAAGQTAGFGRKLRGLKTTAEELPAYVERVTRHYLAGRAAGESFAQLGDAGAGGGAAMSDERSDGRSPLLLPVLRRGGPAAHTRTRTAPGSAAVRPGLLGEVPGTGGDQNVGGEAMTAAARLPIEARSPSRWPTAAPRASRASPPRSRRVGRRAVRRPVLRDQLVGRRRARPRRVAGRARRDGHLPRHRPALRRDAAGP